MTNKIRKILKIKTIIKNSEFKIYVFNQFFSIES